MSSSPITETPKTKIIRKNPCDDCGKKFYKKHLTESNTGKYYCEVCINKDESSEDDDESSEDDDESIEDDDESSEDDDESSEEEEVEVKVCGVENFRCESCTHCSRTKPCECEFVGCDVVGGTCNRQSRVYEREDDDESSEEEQAEVKVEEEVEVKVDEEEKLIRQLEIVRTEKMEKNNSDIQKQVDECMRIIEEQRQKMAELRKKFIVRNGEGQNRVRLGKKVEMTDEAREKKRAYDRKWAAVNQDKKREAAKRYNDKKRNIITSKTEGGLFVNEETEA